ncbi:hypothetical protein Tco_1300848 [Tanacetum coccineum]
MAESSTQEQILQQDQPESPIPFDHATQVLFNIDDIIFNDNNEVALLYPPHTNSNYFKVVSNFIFKCCLREAFKKSPNQYKEYLSEFWNVIGVNYLSHSIEYAKVPSLETLRAWFSTIGYRGKTGGFDQISNKDATILYCLANGVDIDYARLIWEDIINKLNKKTRKKVVPYPRFLSLLLEHKMEGYGNDYVTINPTQVFSVHNWALKKNQAEGPLFIPYILAICSADEPVAFEAPITSLTSKKDTKATNPEANSQTGHSVKETQSSSAKDTNQSQPPTSKPVVAGMHKEVQQPVYLASTIPHSKFASRNEASVDSIAETDHGKTDPNDSISQQQGIVKGTKNFSFDHIFVGTDPHVLVEKTKSASEGLETVLTQLATGKGASYVEKEITFTEKDARFRADEFLTSPDLFSFDDTKKEIKLEDLSC